VAVDRLSFLGDFQVEATAHFFVSDHSGDTTTASIATTFGGFVRVLLEDLAGNRAEREWCTTAASETMDLVRDGPSGVSSTCFPHGTHPFFEADAGAESSCATTPAGPASVLWMIAGAWAWRARRKA